MARIWGANGDFRHLDGALDGLGGKAMKTAHTPNSWTALEQTLFNALVAAQQHLEYCGYGDKWERDIAKAKKLPEQVETALAKALETKATGGQP